MIIKDSSVTTLLLNDKCQFELSEESFLCSIISLETSPYIEMIIKDSSVTTLLLNGKCQFGLSEESFLCSIISLEIPSCVEMTSKNSSVTMLFHYDKCHSEHCRKQNIFCLKVPCVANEES